MACKYEGCNEPVNEPHDNELCVFHAPKERKGEYAVFHNKILDKMSRGNFNYKGYVFPKGFIFRAGGRKDGGKIHFQGEANFSNTQYFGEVDFREAIFEYAVDFSNAKFYAATDFSNTTFKKGKARLLKEPSTPSFYCADFSNCIFNGNTKFDNITFEEGDVNFNYSEFRNGEVSFQEIDILKGSISFNTSKFLSTTVIFKWCTFNKDVFFINLYLNTVMKFSYNTFSEKSSFYFRKINFNNRLEDKSQLMVVFKCNIFNPFASYIESIRIKESINSRPCILFRYCQLKDVYFTDNDMSLLSFYKSSFDQAQISSSDWGIEKDRILFFRFKRQNVIVEERFLEEISKNKNNEEQVQKLRKKYLIEELKDHEVIASLYRQMKTALDNTKDYQQASWFYFNEFEMKRRHLEEQIESSKPKRITFRWQPFIWLNQQRKKLFSRYLLFFSYKVLAGYGEKPLWSSIWFFVFSIIFSFIHLFTGLFKETRIPQEMQYNIIYLFSDLKTVEFWKDFVESLIYTVSRVLPVSYISTSPTDCYPFATIGKIASVFNSIILIILVVFIAIGLKRHFRRF